MRFERLAAVMLLVACPDEKPAVAPPSRFAGVSSKPLTDAKRFCDKTWAAGERAYEGPSTKPFEGAPVVERGKGWRWVNVWATWCAPCVDEMAVLSRWRSAFEKDDLDVTFEMLSIDEADAQPAMRSWLGRLPGALSWAQSPDEVPAWLERVGVSSDSVIPIHILVDAKGSQRCVRVGGVHAQDYGAIRSLLSAD